MRKILGAVSLLALTIGTAGAADLGVRSRIAGPAPYAVPAFNWTGFYIGAHGGYGWGRNSGSIGGAGIGSTDIDGGFGGGQIGFNWQTGGFVLGLEADAAFADISSGSLGGVASTSINGFGTARGRVGFAWDRALIYGTGGFAWASQELNVAGVSQSRTHTGYAVGGGVEYAFTPNWSAKVEYLYLDVGSKNYFAGIAPPGIDVDSRFHTIKFGINYRFGGMGPVMASY